MRWPGRDRPLEELVAEHYGSLYRYAFRLSGSAQEAEDIVQETFCQAQLKWGQLREPGRARSWLFTILRNGFLHRIRDRSSAKVIPLQDIGDLPERLTEPAPVIDPVSLQAVLADLPEDFSTPIILYYFEDFSYRDIADQMGVPIGTVMSRLARAKAFLRNRLLPKSAVAAGPVAEEGV